jgi:hypothetical protein
MTAAYPAAPAGPILTSQPGAPLWRQLIDALTEGRRRVAEDFLRQYSRAHSEYRE